MNQELFPFCDWFIPGVAYSVSAATLRENVREIGEVPKKSKKIAERVH